MNVRSTRMELENFLVYNFAYNESFENQSDCKNDLYCRLPIFRRLTLYTKAFLKTI